MRTSFAGRSARLMRPGSGRWAAATAIEIRLWRRPSRRHSDQQTSGPDCVAWWCRTKLTLGVRRFGRPERILSGPLSNPGSSSQPHHGPARMSPSLIIRESQGHDLANARWERLVRRTSRADHTSRQVTRQDGSHVKTGDESHVKTDMLRRTQTHPSRPTRRKRPSDLGEHWEHRCER